MRGTKITAGDGAGIVVRSVGTGPGIVILHGGGVAERDYRRLAQALSDRFTAHLYNRRGRPDAPPLDGTHTIETDIEDLAAVLEHTGARSVFGHSGGGFVALRAALSLSLERVAVYDPGVCIPGCLPTAFVEPFELAVRAGDYPRALAVLSRGIGSAGPASKLPLGVHILIARAFLRTPVGRRFADLLPTAPPEVRQILAHEGPATDYAAITAEVLLASGSRSQRYFAQICDALAGAVPTARTIVIPRSSHNAANIARKRFVRPFATFFSGALCGDP